jgi:antitoxin component YwqK of YwqJK toxin-antitoxin module
MRLLFTLFSLLFYTCLNAQCKTFKLTSKGDTINCTEANGLKRGKWKIETPPIRGERGYIEEGIYVNDKKEGTWRRFNLLGDPIAIENYKWGLKNGVSSYYTIQGVEREESWKAIDPSKPYDTIDVQDINNPNVYEKVIVKTTGASLKHGTWKIYDPYTGQKLSTEHWILDVLQDPNAKKEMLFDASEGLPNIRSTKLKADTATKKVIPKEVLEFQKKNKGKKIVDGKTGG